MFELNNTFYLNRIIYPVGQGAFYIEKIMANNHEEKAICIVYDCGSQNKTTLYEAIDVFCQLQQDIHILFISHFDEDHINGIDRLKERCYIHYVIMPYIAPDEINLILSFYKYRSKKVWKQLTELLLSPKTFFGEKTVILHIKPIEIIQNEKDEAINNNQVKHTSMYSPPKDIILPEYPTQSEFIKDNLFESGQRFHIERYPFWQYVPFNFFNKKDDFRKQLIKHKIKRKYVSNNKLANRVFIEKLKQIYNNLDGTMNATSLMLYSSPAITNESFSPSMYINYYQIKYSLFCPSNPDTILIKTLSSSCLYTGDISFKQRLNEKSLAEFIKEKLKKYYFYNNNNSEIKIGLIQVPHHGSANSFHLSFFDIDSEAYFLSCGKNNKYKHPSQYVTSKFCIVVPSDSKLKKSQQNNTISASNSNNKKLYIITECTQPHEQKKFFKI